MIRVEKKKTSRVEFKDDSHLRKIIVVVATMDVASFPCALSRGRKPGRMQVQVY